VVPGLGALMGQDSGLPASFTRNYDYPDLLIALLQFAIAGIVAVSLNWVFQRPQKARHPKMFQTSGTTLSVPIAAAPVSAPAEPARTVVAQTVLAAPEPARIAAAEPGPARAPIAVSPSSAVSETSSTAPKPAPAPAIQPTPVVSAAMPAAAPAAAVAKPQPANPAKEKAVYYNLVGEPVSADED